jgi:hypothetical protein
MHREGGDVSTLLVAIPGLLAVYLARPGEHVLASRLLVGTRIVVAMAGILSFAAAGSLIVLAPGRLQAIVWLAIAGLAWVCWVLTFISYLLPRRGK